MAWGAAYETPEEMAEKRAQQDAALEAQQRAKLSQFERRVVDLLTDIAESLAVIAGLGPKTESRGSEGDVGTASAGPASTPGPARPEPS